jgi:hypothetical protein
MSITALHGKKVRIGMVFVSALALYGCMMQASAGTGVGGVVEDGLPVRIVYVYGPADGEKLRVSVSSGTVVIWLNRSGDTIRIVFPGSMVAIATLSPVNVSFTADGGADSVWIVPGAIAGLCFVQPGSYVYRVEHPDSSGCAKPESSCAGGTVVVR